MEVVICQNADEVAALAADAIARIVSSLASPVLGLATGSTPVATYRELARRHRDQSLSFAHARAFLLDEYVGLREGHPEAYRSFIRREFADQVDLADDLLFGPDTFGDLATAGERYEQLISVAGGIDIQLLGIGSDGHIGFNEPMSSLGSRTRIKTLTDVTRSDNARFFDGDIDQVPRHVLTQGIGTILDARHVLLLATGEGKAVPIARAVEGPVAAAMPASALQMHPHVTVIIDEAAAQDLVYAEYYRSVYANKPGWQLI